MSTHTVSRRITALLLAAAAVIGAGAPEARAQTAADSAAIRATALDYIEGWYDADGDRMARALHPELVKRIHVTDPRSGEPVVDGQGKSRLVASTRAGGGSETPRAERGIAVRILDAFRGAAVVRVDAAGWVDYLQMVEEDGRWLILNVLWELREEPEGPGAG